MRIYRKLTEAATASSAMLSRVTAATLVRWPPVMVSQILTFTGPDTPGPDDNFLAADHCLVLITTTWNNDLSRS